VGAAVLPFARAALNAVAGARAIVDDLTGLVRGQVTAGMVSGCALPVLAELLATFHELHPGVRVTLVEDGSDLLTERLRDGTLDLALIGSAGSPAEGVDTAIIADEELVAMTSISDPAETMTVAALRDEPLICLPPGTGVRTALDAACAAEGFTPWVVFEASALPMVAHLAARGLGTAILPASVALAHAPALRAIAITGPPMRSRLELAWSCAVPANPAARTLIEHVRTFVADCRA
jgi:DNA-binding transcriptional LysR family regulator